MNCEKSIAVVVHLWIIRFIKKMVISILQYFCKILLNQTAMYSKSKKSDFPDNLRGFSPNTWNQFGLQTWGYRFEFNHWHGDLFPGTWIRGLVRNKPSQNFNIRIWFLANIVIVLVNQSFLWIKLFGIYFLPPYSKSWGQKWTVTTVQYQIRKFWVKNTENTLEKTMLNIKIILSSVYLLCQPLW